MTKLEMAGVLKRLQEKENTFREAGQKEYAHDEDNAFANFERIANQLGLDRKEVLYVYLFKHLDGIVSYIKGHRSQRESVEGRILDARVYLALLAGMIQEEEENAKVDKRLKDNASVLDSKMKWGDEL